MRLLKDSLSAARLKDWQGLVWQASLVLIGSLTGWSVCILIAFGRRRVYFLHPGFPIVIAVTYGLITIAPPVGLIITLVFMLQVLHKRSIRLIALAKTYESALAKKYDIEEDGLGRGPQSFNYVELSTATKGFSSNELLGSGGFGSVYRGSLVLKGDKQPTEIAVKRISASSDQGAGEFLAEVRIIGQVQHRNLVRVLGWCCEKDELLIVYNYMPNGSVHQHLHTNTTTGELVLTWARRLRIVSGVATALSYLHEEWEQRVIHRDVKSSNVLLDKDFNARLGDFGLARLSEHNQASTVAVAGTYGYLAPELFQTMKPTEKTDVYSFGAMVLEVATGKKPLLSVQNNTSSDRTFLVDWVWDLYKRDILLEAADCQLHNAYDPGEMIMFLKIGLLCCHPNPDERPKMREVINIWKGSNPFPALPRSKPVPIFAQSIGNLIENESSCTIQVQECGSKHTTTVSFDMGRTCLEADVCSTVGTSTIESDGHAVTILSKDVDHFPPQSERHEEQKVGSPLYPTLGRRPRTTRSLPF